MTQVKSIRKYCLDYAGNSPKEVHLCPANTCALHPFRMGKNPNYFKLKTANVKILEDSKEEQKNLRYQHIFEESYETKEV